MRSTRLAVAGGVLGLSVLGAAPALAVCDPYSGECPAVDSERTAVLPFTETRGDVATQTQADVAGRGVSQLPASLPFTGGELALLGVLGVAALGGGIAFVVAGQRRPTSD
jgi:hypothetical protein